MGLGEELKTEVSKVFRERWKVRDGTVVPQSEDLPLANEGVELDATVLYADLAESTALVDRHTTDLAGEVYKSYLYCAAKIIRSEGGEITAYDGDRIMAIYIGSTKNSSAARTALKINYAVREIINPALANVYSTGTYTVKQVVGVDTSKLRAARTGVRGANDLVWIGRAANYAAKLTALDSGYPSYISDRVYAVLMDEAKTTAGRLMWKQFVWNGAFVYRSTWQWPI
jgi:class 3 adenylate cyclase